MCRKLLSDDCFVLHSDFILNKNSRSWVRIKCKKTQSKIFFIKINFYFKQKCFQSFMLILSGILLLHSFILAPRGVYPVSPVSITCDDMANKVDKSSLRFFFTGDNELIFGWNTSSYESTLVMVVHPWGPQSLSSLSIKSEAWFSCWNDKKRNHTCKIAIRPLKECRSSTEKSTYCSPVAHIPLQVAPKSSPAFCFSHILFLNTCHFFFPAVFSGS